MSKPNREESQKEGSGQETASGRAKSAEIPKKPKINSGPAMITRKAGSSNRPEVRGTVRIDLPAFKKKADRDRRRPGENTQQKASIAKKTIPDPVAGALVRPSTAR